VAQGPKPLFLPNIYPKPGESAMRGSLTMGSVAFGLVALFMTGCGQGVQGDRSIHFSSDGKSVSFHNGRDGVFVADLRTGESRKIFEPTPDIVATSAPLWAPDGKRLIFTTARLGSGEPGQATNPNTDNPFYGKQEIVYTCWLRDEAMGENADNVKLFEASCDHAGYVGANLAVRWHPKGDRILFVNQTGAHQHSHELYAYDLASEKKNLVFPHSAQGLVFDFDPTGRHLAVVTGHVEAGGARAVPDWEGLFVTPVEKENWLYVAGSHELARADITSLIERLRATLPVWTVDGKRFAFVTSVKGDDEKPARHTLRLGSPAAENSEALIEGANAFHDLHWSPDGERLGFVRGQDFGSLAIFNTKDKKSTEIDGKRVRRFAGWDSTGKHLAYVVAEQPSLASPFALVLSADAGARDGVYLADGDGKGPGKVVFSGMHVTFPKWSPSEAKLSLWLTFQPTHRSLPARVSGVGVPTGDPAATLDIATGHVTWMATNAWEKAQIGHYHLARHNYEQAWNWYMQAEQEAKPDVQMRPDEALVSLRDLSFFQYCCLTKLGRAGEAQERLGRFERMFNAKPLAEGAEPRGPERKPPFDWTRDPTPDGAALLCDLCAAEAFLSINALEDGQSFFEKLLKDAATDDAKLRSALILSQYHLLQNHNADFVHVAGEAMLPMVIKMWRPASNGETSWWGRDDSGALTLAVLALSPLASPEFLKTIPDEEIHRLARQCEELAVTVKENVPRLGVDLILKAAYDRLGMDKEKKEVGERMGSNPARAHLLTPEMEEDPAKALREGVLQYEALLRALSGV
jgi:Tol biopolymer transport system component